MKKIVLFLGVFAFAIILSSNGGLACHDEEENPPPESSCEESDPPPVPSLPSDLLEKIAKLVDSIIKVVDIVCEEISPELADIKEVKWSFVISF